MENRNEEDRGLRNDGARVELAAVSRPGSCNNAGRRMSANQEAYTYPRGINHIILSD